MPAEGVYFCRCPSFYSRDNLVTERNCNACVEQEKNHSPEKWRPKPQINPSLLQKAKNFGVAGIRHALTGAKKATEEVQELRLETCKACEYFDGQKCQHANCGCTNFALKLS